MAGAAKGAPSANAAIAAAARYSLFNDMMAPFVDIPGRAAVQPCLLT
jgi:hypothetical protein